MVVNEYLNGSGGYGYLSTKHGVKGDSQISQWVNAYRNFGLEGLERKKNHTVYSVQFKVNAVELYLRTELSYREVANQLGINRQSIVERWCKKFLEEGVDGLSKTKGRPSAMSNKKKVNPVNQSKNTQKDRLEELEKQVRLLEIENAYLKELRRLGLSNVSVSSRA
ncbi:transposase [Marinilactibacillus psychrotolerans]|uniref:transposase n=1 Tax=Marinilactibacillus psychrotolerans TaxID=191770 RepID=UPI003885F2FB